MKSLLCQSNRLQQKGHIERADALANKIILSSVKTKLTVAKVNYASAIELWASADKVRNPLHVTGLPNILHNPDTIINSFFAKVASKADHDAHELDQFVCGDDGSYTPISNVQVEALLRNIKSTASGSLAVIIYQLCYCAIAPMN